MTDENGQIIIAAPAAAEKGAMAREGRQLVEKANGVAVLDAESHGTAQEFLRAVARAERQVVELFVTPKKAAHEAHRAICKAETTLLDPLRQARGIVSRKIIRYEDAKRERAAEEARRKQEEARQKEEERRLQEAIALEAEGDKAAAEEVLEEPVEVPAPRPAPETVKVEGVSRQTRWKPEIVDKRALLAFVLADFETWGYLVEPAMVQLNKLATAHKGTLEKLVKGVRAVPETTSTVRA